MMNHIVSRLRLGLIATLLAIAPNFSLHGATILSDLFGTGYDSSGVLITPGSGGTDAHYIITSLPSGPTIQPLFVTSSSTYPFPAWEANSGASEWVSPQLSYSGSQQDPIGAYVVQTSFNLTGFDPDSVAFSVATVWGDDNITSIFINGFDLGVTKSPAYSTGDSLSILTALSTAVASHAFTTGVNTLTITYTQNPPTGPGVANASGVRVEIAATATATAVPEPTTIALLVAGVAFIALRRRRR